MRRTFPIEYPYCLQIENYTFNISTGLDKSPLFIHCFIEFTFEDWTLFSSQSHFGSEAMNAPILYLKFESVNASETIFQGFGFF